MFDLIARHPFLKRLIPSRFTAILLLLLAYVWFRPPAWVSHPQRPAPAVNIDLLDGRQIKLTSLRGQVVLVNFWASWCPYCVRELPQIQTFYRDWHGRGFTVLALSLDDNPQIAASYLSKGHYDFPAGMANAASLQAFGGVHQIPSSFIIDRQGIIHDAIRGQVYYGRLEDLVKPLLLNPH